MPQFMQILARSVSFDRTMGVSKGESRWYAINPNNVLYIAVNEDSEEDYGAIFFMQGAAQLLISKDTYMSIMVTMGN